MKKHYYILIGFLMVVLPVLLAQIFIQKDAPRFHPAPKQTPFVTVNPKLQQLMQEYEKELTLLRLFSKTPGAAIAVVKDSTIVYMKGFGVKEAGTKDSINVNTVFRLASVSKCFASFLAGILVEENKINWNDRVVHYLPDFRLHSVEQTRELSLRHVLSHSTGLPFHAYTNLVEAGLPLPDMLARLQQVPLVSKPGELYSYQNVAYSLIGEAIKSATRKSYEGWMIEKVFAPLGMSNASIDYFSMVTNENIAKPHLPRRDGWRTVGITNTYYNVSPAGGINASISDMAKWMIALLGHRPDVISPATLDTLYKPSIKAPSKNRNYGRLHRLSDSYYGLGWRILHYPDDTLVYHGGYVNGYRSEVAVNQRHNIAICILANAPGELPDNGIPLFFDLYKRHQDAINQWEFEQVKFLQDSLPL